MRLRALTKGGYTGGYIIIFNKKKKVKGETDEI